MTDGTTLFHIAKRADQIKDALPVKDELVWRTDEAARVLGISPYTLQSWRSRGEGPPFSRMGKRIIVYRRREIEQWLTDQAAAAGATKRAMR